MIAFAFASIESLANKGVCNPFSSEIARSCTGFQLLFFCVVLFTGNVTVTVPFKITVKVEGPFTRTVSTSISVAIKFTLKDKMGFKPTVSIKWSITISTMIKFDVDEDHLTTREEIGFPSKNFWAWRNSSIFLLSEKNCGEKRFHDNFSLVNQFKVFLKT